MKKTNAGAKVCAFDGCATRRVRGTEYCNTHNSDISPKEMPGEVLEAIHDAVGEVGSSSAVVAILFDGALYVRRISYSEGVEYIASQYDAVEALCDGLDIVMGECEWSVIQEGAVSIEL